ncbi:MAG: PP2C family protein-serine/threonine phosphatase [Leptolyngbyaceae cyanobacterium]
MKSVYSGLTDVGLLRTVNQDAFYIDPEGRFFIVADGMGGHAGGQEASWIAAQTIRHYLESFWGSSEPSSDLLKASLLQANAAILKDQQIHPERSDMGTTIVVLVLRDGGAAWCAHIGDSRLYRLRDANLEQITEDHTWVAQAIRFGEITPDLARMHPWRHVLSQCLGREDLYYLDIQPVAVEPGDRLLLCSDGLTEELSDSMILTHLQSISDCEKATASLVNAAKDQGGRDNITVVVVALDH